VYVKTPVEWNTPYIHAKQGNTDITAPMPGDTLSPAGDGWYLRDLAPGSYDVTFSDGKDKKSNTFKLDKTRWCELQADGTCVWKDEDPRTPQNPALDIQPRGKAFRGSLEVKIAWTGDESADCRYTLDGSDAKTNPLAPACRNRNIITLGTNAKIGDKIALQVCVSNTLSTPCDTQTYTKTDTAEFSWDNATVYFVLTDRFNNGDSSNDGAYGRKRDGQDDIGTWHGGDLKGLMAKLQPEIDGKSYFQKLGINAIWISSPVEQMHGWVPGGSAKFQHYAYHGYYPKDFTKLDANLGTPDDFKNMVDLAHSQGIRIVMDVVMNHTGYYSTQDLSEDGMNAALAANWKSATLDNYFTMINFQSNAFANGWGPKWIRAGLPGHTMIGPDTKECPKIDNCPETANLFFLPDLKTESSEFVGLPPFIAARATKGETNAKALNNATVRDYLTDWLSQWVATYGVDGFRVDTIKHVEVASWQLLKQKSTAALRQWKAANPTKKIDDLDFWMTGEYWRHGPSKVSPNGTVYLHHGFDSVINFEFQYAVRESLNNPAGIEATYAKYAKQVNTDDELQTLSYVSSHDRGLFTGMDPPDIATNPTGAKFAKKTAGANNDAQKKAGTLLLLAPGGVQIYYGDETARADGAYYDTDPAQASRSFMNWGDITSGLVQDVLLHWQKVGQFRQQHVAIGAGVHKQLTGTPYTFSRIKGDDKVVVAVGAKGKTDINVAGVFADGAVLKDHYTGNSVTVANGKANVSAHANGVVLLAP
jgi:alpha-amylase